MITWNHIKIRPKFDPNIDIEYLDSIYEIINHPLVQSMSQYIQHGGNSCLDHSLYVSYNCYLLCRYLGLDYRSAARGGLLHDFFLYDWHQGERPYKGFHGIHHPRIALENANKYFRLNKKEKDIIKKHMWPVTLALPKYWESVIIVLVDKYCAIMEFFHLENKYNIRNILMSGLN